MTNNLFKLSLKEIIHMHAIHGKLTHAKSVLYIDEIEIRYQDGAV